MSGARWTRASTSCCRCSLSTDPTAGLVKAEDRWLLPLVQKAQDSLRGLENWLKSNPSAPYHDRLVARSLADDLLDALGQAP